MQTGCIDNCRLFAFHWSSTPPADEHDDNHVLGKVEAWQAAVGKGYCRSRFQCDFRQE